MKRGNSKGAIDKIGVTKVKYGQVGDITEIQFITVKLRIVRPLPYYGPWYSKVSEINRSDFFQVFRMRVSGPFLGPDSTKS